MGKVGCRPGCQVGHLHQGQIQGHRQGTVTHQGTQGVRVEGAQGRSNRPCPSSHRRGQQGRGRQEGGTGFQGDRSDVHRDAFEGLVEVAQAVRHDPLATAQLGRSGIVGVESGAGRRVQLQLDGGHALLQFAEHDLVSRGRFRIRDLLPHIPAVEGMPQRARSPGVGRTPRETRRVIRRGTALRGVDRLNINAVIGMRDHFLFERHTFQVSQRLRLPGLVADRREIVQDLQLLRRS